MMMTKTKILIAVIIMELFYKAYDPQNLSTEYVLYKHTKIKVKTRNRAMNLKL